MWRLEPKGEKYPLLADRPSTVVGLISDLCKKPSEAFIFVVIIGSLVVIVTLCLVGVCFAVIIAARGIKGIPLGYTLPIGFGGASLITLLTTIVKSWVKASRAAAANDHKKNGKG